MTASEAVQSHELSQHVCQTFAHDSGVEKLRDRNSANRSACTGNLIDGFRRKRIEQLNRTLRPRSRIVEWTTFPDVLTSMPPRQRIRGLGSRTPIRRNLAREGRLKLSYRLLHV
jgi:hypothetical protein